MGKIQVKGFDQPDEIISVPGSVSNVVTLGDTYVAWTIAQPGWRWSKDVKPLVGTPSCLIHHQGVVLSGQMQISSEEGVQRIIGPREAFDIQPGHDGWVVGEEPCIFIEFHGVREWGKPQAMDFWHSSMARPVPFFARRQSVLQHGRTGLKCGSESTLAK